MTRNQDIGKKSEDYVADYLVSRGATILSRNYSVHNVGELDIICSYKGKILIPRRITAMRIIYPWISCRIMWRP